MKIVATTSLPAVDRPNADRWNAACSRQNNVATNIVASRPAECRPTGMPHARAEKELSSTKSFDILSAKQNIYSTIVPRGDLRWIPTDSTATHSPAALEISTLLKDLDLPLVV